MAKKKRRKSRGESGGAVKGLSLDTLRKYAAAGASATLAKLREEIQVIERTFPELSSAKARGKVATTVQKRASRMTAAGRAAVSARMKKYWAERRKQSKAKS